jgi:hypothetical protein
MAGLCRIYFLKESSDGLGEHGNEIPVRVKVGNVCTRWSTVSLSIKLLLYELITEPISWHEELTDAASL